MSTREAASEIGLPGKPEISGTAVGSSASYTPVESISRDFLRRFDRRGKGTPRFRLGWIAAIGTVCLLCGPSNLHTDGNVFFVNRTPVHRVKISAYTNVPQCTDSTPNQTASMLQIKRKHYWRLIALSRDLARGYRFGDRFILRVNGKSYPVEFQDLMAARHRNQIDFLLPSVKRALQFGVNEGVLIPVGTSGRKQLRKTG